MQTSYFLCLHHVIRHKKAHSAAIADPPVLILDEATSSIDTRTEGFILGVGTNMFKIAGPVIVYGMVASVVYGIIYWVTTLF